jgi:hypothetical protein
MRLGESGSGERGLETNGILISSDLIGGRETRNPARAAAPCEEIWPLILLFCEEVYCAVRTSGDAK